MSYDNDDNNDDDDDDDDDNNDDDDAPGRYAPVNTRDTPKSAPHRHLREERTRGARWWGEHRTALSTRPPKSFSQKRRQHRRRMRVLFLFFFFFFFRLYCVRGTKIIAVG